MNIAQTASKEINDILVKHCPDMTNSQHIVMRIELLQVIERALNRLNATMGAQ